LSAEIAEHSALYALRQLGFILIAMFSGGIDHSLDDGNHIAACDIDIGLRRQVRSLERYARELEETHLHLFSGGIERQGRLFEIEQAGEGRGGQLLFRAGAGERRQSMARRGVAGRPFPPLRGGGRVSDKSTLRSRRPCAENIDRASRR